jgi:hypothetical protein
MFKEFAAQTLVRADERTRCLRDAEGEGKLPTVGVGALAIPCLAREFYPPASATTRGCWSPWKLLTNRRSVPKLLGTRLPASRGDFSATSESLMRQRVRSLGSFPLPSRTAEPRTRR